MQWDRLGATDVFKKGDLFFLNKEGKILYHHIQGENGFIMSEAYVLFEHDFHSTPEKLEFKGYDVLIKGRLFKEIPEKFLMRVIKDEEDAK